LADEQEMPPINLPVVTVNGTPLGSASLRSREADWDVYQENQPQRPAEQVHAHPSPLNDRSLQQGFDNAICANRGAPPQSEM
jgi:hypothetical protein